LVNRFDLVIFDLDGTLANTFPLVVGAFNYAVSSRLNREYTLDELKKYFGPPEVEILRRIFPLPEDHEVAIDSFHRFNRENHLMVEPIDGMRELLLKLKEQGIKLAVYTGAGHQAGADRVDHAGLSDLFELVLGGDEVTKYKPHPEGIEVILNKFSVKRERSAFVGDSAADIEAGREAHVTSIAVSWGVSPVNSITALSPDYICESLGQLEEVLLQGSK